MRIFVVLALLSACRGNDIDTAGEAALAAPVGAGATTIATAKAGASLFVQDDPTLDVTKTALENAANVARQVGTGCAQANVTHDAASTTITVDFGAGCTYPKLGTVSGAAAATVSKSASSLSVAFTFTALTIHGKTLSGTFSETTADDTTFTVDADLTTATDAVSFQGTAALSSDAISVTLDGTGSVTVGTAAPIAVTLTSVDHPLGGCYADAGTLEFTKPSTKNLPLDETIVFSSATPATGQVAITVDGLSSTQTLPPYATCPHQ